MKPALSQVCTLNAPMEQDIADYAAGHCHALELWLGKLESYLEGHSVDDLRRLLDEHQMQTPVASFQGGLLTSQGDYRRQHWDHFARRLPVLQQIGVETLVVAGDAMGPVEQPDFERLQVSLRQAADQAAQHNVRIALEFQARATIGNNLQTIASILAQQDHPNLGICFDLFHYYTGPSKLEDLVFLTPENLFHVQLCDLSGTPREMATDSDRILPGDGDFNLEPIIEHLGAIGYDRYVSIELMNPQIWQVSPRSFGEIGMTALRKVLGQASMGGDSRPGSA